MKMHSKIHVFIYSICLLSFHWTTHAVSSRFLDDVSSTDVNAVRIRLSEEKSKRLLLQNDIETLMGKVEELERKLNDQPASIGCPRSPPTPVHFNAKLTPAIDVDALHVIVFDEIIENEGECYSASTGIFRAKHSGQYQFTLYILSRAKAQYAHLQLMKNTEEIGRIFAGSDATGWPQAASCTVTTHLSEGDEVYAREFPEYTGHLHGDSFCSFSGVLLQNEHE